MEKFKMATEKLKIKEKKDVHKKAVVAVKRKLGGETLQKYLTTKGPIAKAQLEVGDSDTEKEKLNPSPLKKRKKPRKYFCNPLILSRVKKLMENLFKLPETLTDFS
uniref:L3mbtl1_0 protein n=1 Tax=Fopius arisanus TaxID=64838 RepID=A0A0C9QPS8_9HYME